MANNKFYGYTPKNEKPLKTQGQAYSGAEKSNRVGQMTKDGSYANFGNRLDRINPYEFRKGMDYELVALGCSRLIESTPEEREKATETVLKNLENTHPAYYSALVQFELGMNQGGKITETSFNKFLETFSKGHGDGMISVEKEIKDDKMIEPKYDKKDYTVPFKTSKLKEAIKARIKAKLFENKKDEDNDDEDEDVTAKKASKGAKKASKGMARFDKEEKAIDELLFGKPKGDEEVSEENPGKGSLLFLKDKFLEAYKQNKDVEAYKKAIQLQDAVIKKLEKHIKVFGKEGTGNNVTIDSIKGKDLPDTIKKLEARRTSIEKERQEVIANVGRQKNEIAATDMSRANHLRLLEIIKENGISLREGAEGIRTYYEIAKTAYLEGLSKGLRL